MTDPALLRFTPVPFARRARGWTPDAQCAFIDALSRCGVVAQAARSVGRTARSAYQLRQRPGADSFAAAWDWALEMGLDEARARAVALIQGGEERHTTRHGHMVTRRRMPDTRLVMAALRALGAEQDGGRDAMPHRQRMALRDLLRRMVRDGPFSPDEWAGLVPALRTLSGDPDGAAPLS